MNENQTINVALTIDEIKYAAKVIRKDATQESEEATLAKLERVIEAYDYVAKRKAKRKKEADAVRREVEAVDLLSGRAVPPPLCLSLKLSNESMRGDAGDLARAFGFEK